jgi:3-keto-disaccharide hydrolase
MRALKAAGWAGIIAVLAGCPAPAPPMEIAMRTPDHSADGWRPLFDGRTAEAWRGWRSDRLPAGWRIADGALTRVAPAGDIVTREQFGDFELALEWKVERGGNSGVFYRVSEAPGLEYVWESGPELQVLDDAGHPDGSRPETLAGSCYGLYPAPRGVVRAAGEWNDVRILLLANHVEHWLNGRKVVEYELGSAEWRDRVRGSKFATMPRYGREPRGHIALQDHGDWVAYRNVRIRESGSR